MERVSPETLLLLVLAAVAVIVAVRWVADRTGLPAAALLTVIGIAYALLPGPNLSLDPHVVLTLVIPPLLYSAALDSSLTALRLGHDAIGPEDVLLALLEVEDGTGVLAGLGIDRARVEREVTGAGD